MQVAHRGLVVLLALGLLIGCSRLPSADIGVDTAQRGPHGVGLAFRKLSAPLPSDPAHTVQTWVWYPSSDLVDQTTATVSARPGSEHPVAPGRPFPLIVF